MIEIILMYSFGILIGYCLGRNLAAQYISKFNSNIEEETRKIINKIIKDRK